MTKLLMWLCVFACLVSFGCQASRSGIDVLGKDPKATDKPSQEQYVVNGGPGSTEIVYRDAQGNQQTAASNVVRVPIQERCEPKEEVKEVPQELPKEEEKPVEAKPVPVYTVELNTLQNIVLASASKMPDVVYQTEVFVPRQPPKMELIKSSDEKILCCDKQLTFRLKYKNIGGDDALNLDISDIIPARVEYLEGSANSVPHMSTIHIARDKDEKAKKIVWHLDGPIMPGDGGEVFYTVVCQRHVPHLSCFLRFEPKVLQVGQEGSVICSVTNKGSGPALNTRLTVQIPPGIEHEGTSLGKKLLLPLGTLEPDKTATQKLTIKMRGDGKLENIAANVVADNWDGCECDIPYAPTLQIEKSGPTDSKNRLPVEYTLVAKNVSSKKAPATNCILTDKLPVHTTFVSASHSGAYDPKTHTVTWKVGTLMPGDIEARTVVIAPEKSGTFVDEAKLGCDEGVAVNDAATTIVTGVAAMMVNKYDTEDPVEMGQTTTYVIEVRNQGFHPITMIEVVSNVPNMTTLLTASGIDPAGNSYAFKLVDDKVVFDAVPVLESGEKAVYKITVRVVDKGQILNVVEAKCKEFAKIIIVEEPTTSY